VIRWAALLVLAACQKAAEPTPAGPAPMAAAEKDRAATICEKYVERVCACAAREPALADACALAKGQPEAVRMHLDVLEGAPLRSFGASGEPVDAGTGRRGPLNEEERRLTESSLRKVVAACVKLDADLDPARCPRP
jgi:hypothetical protein